MGVDLGSSKDSIMEVRTKTGFHLNESTSNQCSEDSFGIPKGRMPKKSRYP